MRSIAVNKQNRHDYQLLNNFQHLKEIPESLRLFLTELLTSEKTVFLEVKIITKVMESYAADLKHGVSREEIMTSKHFLLGLEMHNIQARSLVVRARSLVISDLRSETKGSQFESGCQLCAEVSCLQ